MARAGVLTADMVRLRPLQLRSAALAEAESNSSESEFGLLRDGCRLQSVNKARYSVEFTRNSIGSEWRISTAAQSKLNANGYYLTLASNSSFDPIRWIVEASNDNGSTWTAVSASIWRMTPDGAVQVYPQQSTLTMADSAYLPNTSSAQRAVINVDMRPSVSWALTNCVSIGVAGLGFICCVVAAFFGRISIFMTIFKSIYVIVTLIWLTAAMCSGLLMGRESVVLWSRSIPKLPGALALIFYDTWLLFIFVFWGISDLVLCIATEAFLYQLDWSTFLQILVSSSLSWIHILFAATIIILRKRAVNRANKLMLKDQQRYDKIWATECLQSTAASAIRLLTDECIQILCTCDRTIPRQLKPQDKSYKCKQAHDPKLAKCIANHSLFSWCNAIRTTQGKHSKGVDSLDQLFVQAWCLDPFLLCKARSWADANRGHFPLSNRQGYVLYSSFNSKMEKQIKWGKVKAVQRSIEKVVRIYNKVTFFYYLQLNHFLTLSSHRLTSSLYVMDCFRVFLISQSVFM
jgi:hypothetical protein